MTKIFIDGSAGTTGLRIKDRLLQRKDISLLSLPEEFRKDIQKRKEIINDSDIVFLCLPDSAAIESVSLIENPNVKVIDTSTAHRTADGWAYGFPELKGQREIIKNSNRIANPGCHASGFISLIQPLVQAGLIKKDIYLTCFSLTGYTGGGKKMIAEYESDQKPLLYNAPRQYGLSQQHKHLPEMKVVSGLDFEPCFCPIVSDFDCGMEVTIPLFKKDLRGTILDVEEVYKTTYTGEIVKYNKADENGFLSSNALRGKDSMEISVFGNDERMVLVSRFDNLGKGASGAAIQNMNILLGVDEKTGLEI